MFKEAPYSSIDLKKRNLAHLYVSLNQPQISPHTGGSPESASGNILVIEERPGEVTVFIGLLFLRTKERLLYTSEAFNSELLADRLSEAETFAHEMGFMMDNTNIATASKERREELIRKTPFFYDDFNQYFQALSESEIQAKKSTLDTTAVRGASGDLQRIFLEQYVKMLSML